MSQQQWGHGYYNGFIAGVNQKMQTSAACTSHEQPANEQYEFVQTNDLDTTLLYIVKKFVIDSTAAGTGHRIRRDILYTHYTDYCMQNHVQFFGRNRFYQAMARLGYTEIKSCGIRYFANIYPKENDIANEINQAANNNNEFKEETIFARPNDEQIRQIAEGLSIIFNALYGAN